VAIDLLHHMQCTDTNQQSSVPMHRNVNPSGNSAYSKNENLKKKKTIAENIMSQITERLRRILQHKLEKSASRVTIAHNDTVRPVSKWSSNLQYNYSLQQHKIAKLQYSEIAYSHSHRKCCPNEV